MQRLKGLASGRSWIKIAADAVMVALSFLVALSIRFEFLVPSPYFTRFLMALPGFVLVFVLTNYVMRMYSKHWKYASFDELINLASSATLSTAVLFLAVLLIPGARKYVPISVIVMGGVISLFSMAFIRLQFRLLGERKIMHGDQGHRKVLLAGAGETGEMVARDMLRHPEYEFHPVGFVDDDPGKRNMVIHGVPVLGGTGDIPEIARKYEIEEIFITIPSVTGERLREILPFCERTGAQIKILPGIVCTMAGEIGVAALRELRLEDLLGREPVETDLASISAYLTDKVVLVTGAGGSIGSELSRQLCCIGPKKLLLLDHDDTLLYELEMDLKPRGTGCTKEVVVADVRDAVRLEAVFRRHRPQVVFHSAALKHVPLMESHPCEAVKTNVMGTRNLARMAGRYGAERFILISTDKAVRPANVMGATKRLAEQLIKGSNGRKTTKFAAVRFGNVLGSRGSVVPLFRKQIEEGGPLLVTHPEVTRYFMTIEEAAELVIQAGAFAEGGEIFILEMGKPVLIMDLANQMVRLLGRGRDIEIRVTELRPGEKMSEELIFESEEMLPTPHPKISKAVHDFDLPQDFNARIDLLIKAAARDDEDEIRVLLSGLLPGHEPEDMDKPKPGEDTGDNASRLRLVKRGLA